MASPRRSPNGRVFHDTSEDHLVMGEESMQRLKRGLIATMIEYSSLLEDMDRRLERLEQDGIRQDDDENTDGSARRAHLSVHELEGRYRDVMAQLVPFLEEKGDISLARNCARFAQGVCMLEPMHKKEYDHEEADDDFTIDSEEEEKQDLAHRGDNGEHDISNVVDEGTYDIKDEDGGEPEQELAMTVWQPMPPQTQAPSPVPIGENPGPWPVGGFADDDPAAAFMIDTMRWVHNRAEPSLTLHDVITVPNPAADKGLRPYQQVLRCGQDDALNIVFPHPDLPDSMMGKIDCSVTGLSVVICGLRAVVCNYADWTSIPPLHRQVERLIAANGAMKFDQPLEYTGTYYVLGEPFEPEGVRSSLAAVQAAARLSTSGYVLFYVHPLGFGARSGRMGALLDIHPIIGWTD